MSDHQPRRWRHRAAATLVATAALAGGGASLAVADITAVTDPRGDARCDERVCPDLKSAVGDHAPLDPTTLFHIVTQHNQIQSARIPRLAIDTRGSSAPEYYVAKKEGKTGVFKARTGRRVGAADLRVNGTGMSWSFDPSAIGDPSSYRWRVQIIRAGGKRIDSLPNRGYRTHRLR
jgi:hypothetical protein